MGEANVYSGHILIPLQPVIFRIAEPGIKQAVTQRAAEQMIAEGHHKDINDLIEAMKRTEGSETPAELAPFIDKVLVTDYWPDRANYITGDGTVLFRNLITTITNWRVIL